MRTRDGLKARFAALVSLVLVVTGSTAVVAEVASAPSASAVVGSQFDPGNIISDAYFFDPNAMSEAQIQAFLDAKIGSCLNSSCLNVLRVNTTNQPAEYTSQGNLVCGAYAGGANERASTIIFKVQQACRISAKVLLVTLQKEQGLVTKRSPTEGTLERAMGYGCPDNNGGVCAEQYYGFFNQMLNAAWQLQRYGTAPVFGTFQPGARSVQWHPNTACGASTITIANRATAALYNYTPYRPNAAALNNLYGTGDGCSSYGNRNFWVYYNDWFGNSTQPPGTPEGSVAVTLGAGTIVLNGWAIDPDAVAAAVPVAVQLDSSWYGLTANVAGESRSDAYPGAGNLHDFTTRISAVAGVHTLCVYLVNAGGPGGQGSLGCQQVVVPESTPTLGAIISATASGRNVSVFGWALHPDQPTSPVQVAVNYGSQWIAMTTPYASPEGQAASPGAGPNQGFAGTFRAEPGVQSFCAWATRPVGGAVNIGCRSLYVPDVDLTIAKITASAGAAAAATVSGWAVWPDDVSASVPVAVNVGSSWYGFSADQPNADAEIAVPGAGPNHGYSATINLPAGSHQLCVWVAQMSSPPKMVGCRTVSVSVAAPTKAELQSVSADAINATVAGWAVWPSNPAATVPLAVNVGANWYAVAADQPNPGGEAAVPGSGPNHGFLATVPIPSGTSSVCLWAVNPAGGASQVGCQSVTRAMPTGAIGELNVLAGGAGGLHYEGWAVIGSAPTEPVSLALNVGASWIGLVTDKPSPLAQQRFSGAGPNQGASGLIPLPVGTHSVCLWASSPAGSVNLGCRTATVGPPPTVAGRISAATGVAGAVDVSGWAVWPSTPTTAVPIAVNIGTSWTVIPADLPGTAASEWVLGAGPNQSFGGIVASPSGRHDVCVWAVRPEGGAALLGCSSVNVP